MFRYRPDCPEDMNTERVSPPTTSTHWRQAIVSGLAGALVVTALNETVRRVLPHAPRMEVIGERALARTLRGLEVEPPRGRRLYWSTLLGDLVSNTAYYSVVGLANGREATLRRGTVLGLLAGVGAVALPGPLGLGRQPGARSPRTPLLTVVWYLAGGLASAVARQRLATRRG